MRGRPDPGGAWFSEGALRTREGPWFSEGVLRTREGPGGVTEEDHLGRWWPQDICAFLS